MLADLTNIIQTQYMHVDLNKYILHKKFKWSQDTDTENTFNWALTTTTSNHEFANL